MSEPATYEDSSVRAVIDRLSAIRRGFELFGISLGHNVRSDDDDLSLYTPEFAVGQVRRALDAAIAKYPNKMLLVTITPIEPEGTNV